MSGKLQIGKHMVVTMQYALTNARGDVMREAGGAAVEYLHGAGTLFPKLEAALENHAIGDIVRVKLLPDDAFGKRDVELLCEVPLKDFPEGEKIEIGSKVIGTDENGRDVRFTVAEIRDAMVHLDGNHPLAGHALVFEVEIQHIRPATDAEISSGQILD